MVLKQKNSHTTTTAIVSKDVLTHEQAVKILAGAIEALRKPGQDKLELQRLRILVDAVQTYDSVLGKFERRSENLQKKEVKALRNTLKTNARAKN